MSNLSYIKATGTNVVVELLEANEILGLEGTIVLPKKTKVPALQGVILDIGPQLATSDYGFKVGDRVVLDGAFVPVPRYNDRSSERDICVFAPHSIKCVLDVEITKQNVIIPEKSSLILEA